MPTPLDRSIELLAAACIPVFLLILGMQLRVSGISGPRGALGLTVGLRLVGGAVVGFLLAGPFGLEGVVRQSAILQSAMPSAVVTTILASEYGCEPGFVTSAVFVSTVVSPLTLTPLLAILGA